MSTINMTDSNTIPKFNDLMAQIGQEEVSGDALTFNQYQALAQKTAVFPGQGQVGGAMYLALGLCGESGEVAEKIKKYFRDGIPKDVDQDDWIEDLVKECGDVLWYLANLLMTFGVSFSDAGVTNLEKLASRKVRGKLGGSGDNR